jgi:hypothetical protein
LVIEFARGVSGGSIAYAQKGEREIEQKEAKGTKGGGQFARGVSGGSIAYAQKGEREIEQKEAREQRVGG